jgi:hypothetical protein
VFNQRGLPNLTRTVQHNDFAIRALQTLFEAWLDETGEEQAVSQQEFKFRSIK